MSADSAHLFSVRRICQIDRNYLKDWIKTRQSIRRSQGFGRFLTGSSGYYYFRTIKPVAYPGRTLHIHFAVKLEGKVNSTRLNEHPVELRAALATERDSRQDSAAQVRGELFQRGDFATGDRAQRPPYKTVDLIANHAHAAVAK